MTVLHDPGGRGLYGGSSLSTGFTRVRAERQGLSGLSAVKGLVSLTKRQISATATPVMLAG